MKHSARPDYLKQKALSREAFEALSSDERKALLEGPLIGICLSWLQITIAPRRLLMTMSPAFNRARQVNNMSVYWTVPSGENTAEDIAAILAICDWMYSICSADKYAPLPPHPIRTVSKAMYKMCIGMDIPPYDGHLSELKQFLESGPEKVPEGKEKVE